MKKLILAITLLFTCLFSFAQQTAPDLLKTYINAGENYYSIINKVDSTIGTDSSIVSNGGYKEYLRWKAFWGDRINYNQNGPEGNFKYALEAMYKYALQPKCEVPDNLTSNWELVGPESEPNLGKQNLGMIISLYMDPNDNNFVVAGSAWGGVWLCTNAMSSTPTWKNLMNGTNLPQIGIPSIAVNPVDRNEVWVSLGWQYGLGIIHCMDISVPNPQWEFIEPEIFPLDQGIIEGDLSVIQKIIVHPDFANSPILYAITGYEVYRIVKNPNGTFTAASQNFPFGTPAPRLRDLEFDPNDPSADDVIVSGQGIWRLDFSNGIWEELFDPSIPIGNVKIAIDGNNIYAFYLSNLSSGNFTQQNIAKFTSPQNWTSLYNQQNTLPTVTPLVYPGTMIFEVNENVRYAYFLC